MYVAGQSSFASVNISYHCLYVFRDIKHYQNNKDKYIVRIIYHFDQERLKLFAVLGFRVILIRLGFPFFFFLESHGVMKQKGLVFLYVSV